MADGRMGDYVDRGTWGLCPWTIDDEGMLVIGAGDATTYVSGSVSPWADYVESISGVRLMGRVIAPRSCASLFRDLTNLRTADLKDLDTSAVTDMSGLFSRCTFLSSLDVSAWDVSQVRNMSDMFACCESLSSVDVSGWDTSQVTDMVGLFAFCDSLSSLDVSGWDTSSVVHTDDMFEYCPSLASIRVGSGYAMKSADMSPRASQDGGTWWSVADGTWYAASEIVANRSGMADTHLRDPL